MEPTIPDATQPASSTGTDANPQATVSSTPATPTSDPAYQSGLQAAINKGLGQTTPSQRVEEPAQEPTPTPDPVEGDPQTPAPTEEQPAEPTPPKEGEGEADPNAPTEESQGPVPYARFSEVVEEKNSALEQVRQLEPAVRDYMQIKGFIENNQLTVEDFHWAMNLVAAKRNNPDAYLKMLEPDLQQVGQMQGGGQLDADLKEAIANGEMSQQWAEKVQAGRAKESFQQQSARARLEAQQRQQVRAVQAGLTNAIMDWVKTKQTSDTEFQPNKKGGIGLHETFAAHLRMAAEAQTPTTPEQMKAMCDRVYAQVKPLFRSQPPRTNGVHVRTNQTTSPNSVRKVETIQDALAAAVEHSNRIVLRGGR